MHKYLVSHATTEIFWFLIYCSSLRHSFYVLVAGPEEGGELCEEAAGAALLEEAEQPRGRGVHGVPAGDATEPARQLHHGGAHRGPPVPGGGGRVPRLLCQVEESPLLGGNLGERKGMRLNKENTYKRGFILIF